MFANVFFEIANSAELESYIEQVNRHLAKTDRCLQLNPEYTGIQGSVLQEQRDNLDEDEDEVPECLLFVCRIIDGQPCFADVYEIEFPTVERPVLVLHSTFSDAGPITTDAAPLHLAQCIDQLAFN